MSKFESPSPLVARWVALLAILIGAATAPADVTEPPVPDVVQFNRDVRPILSESCYACHGFDKNKRKADLRLDTKDGLSKKLDDGLPVVAGKPAESLILARIVTEDPEEVMPPPSAKKPKVTTRQVAVLKKWIEQGAPWEDHWAFSTVKRPEVPAVQDKAWARNAIDGFVLAKLEREGLKPAAEADKATLLRRVTLDLTGLPPTVAEVDAFLADPSPRAYETVVDRLLATPQHAERLALDWLDAARYADTHGYHIDAGRDMTRWREWVIDAFRANKPYDQFTVEQIAGDLLPDAATPEATLAQKVASGFNRNHMVNFEGGAIPEEYRTAYVLDRVNTTGTVFLGMTVACTQCHDHKYDPIIQKEYYQLYAFFNAIDEKGLDGNAGNATPVLAAPSPEQGKRLVGLAAKVKELEATLLSPDAEADKAQATWEAGLASGGAPIWRPADVTDVSSRAKAVFTKQPDGSYVASGPSSATDRYVITLSPGSLKKLTGVRLQALPTKSPAGGPGRSENGNFVLTGVTIEVAGKDGKKVAGKIAKASADYSQKDYDVAAAIDDKPGTGWAIFPAAGKPHEAAFELATPADVSGDGATVVVTLAFESPFPNHQIGRFRLGLTDAPSPAAGAKALPADVVAAMAVPAASRTPAQLAVVKNQFRRTAWAGGKAIRAELSAAKRETQAIEKAVPNTMVMRDLEKPRDTFVFVRGAYDHPGDKVTPGVPAFLPPLPAGAPANRLSLARWLVDRKHPLTSRVTVNRYWQMIFGTGIVKTSDDFGSQGELPSHPELLDWLAAEFMDGPAAADGLRADHWDVRRLLRGFVTSATYRQSSVVTSEAYARDPENRLLGRGTRYRLQAETIRDQALAAAGLLDRRVGGASVSPYQPSGLWEELMSRGDGEKWTAQTYEQSHGPDLYRRTMYTFWKRTCPPPTLATFDAPDREGCTVRRARTNTPLQALVLMNDPTYVEAGRKLAERAMTELPVGATDAERATFAFRSVVARSPTAKELAVLSEILAKQRSKFAADPAAAKKLLAVGESPRDGKLNQAELAAWATTCGVILNLDEAVTRG